MDALPALPTPAEVQARIKACRAELEELKRLYRASVALAKADAARGDRSDSKPTEEYAMPSAFAERLLEKIGQAIEKAEANGQGWTLSSNAKLRDGKPAADEHGALWKTHEPTGELRFLLTIHPLEMPAKPVSENAAEPPVESPA